MENSKIILSIGVPVYNVDKYLRKCVDSLLAQDLLSSEYEIILVDDGSTDTCPQICDEYAVTYANIRVIHQANAGLSAARNTSIAAARGNYIMFVDSDDYLEPDVLGGLMVQIEQDRLDVLRFDYQNVNEQYEIFHPNKAPKRDVDYSEEVTDGETFLNERLGPSCYAVMFIMRRELVPTYTPGIYFEDVDWTPRMIMNAKRIASTPTIVYNYLWRTGSITLPTDPKKREKVLGDKMKLLYGFREQSKLVKNPMWYDWMTSNVAMGVLDSLTEFSLSDRKKYIAELQSIQVFPLSIKRERMRTHRMRIRLANISPNLYCWIMKIRKSI